MFVLGMLTYPQEVLWENISEQYLESSIHGFEENMLTSECYSV